MKRKILIISLVLLLAIVGATWYLSSTEGGLRWLFTQSRRFIPGEISVDSLTGRLIGPLSIKNLTYKSENLNADLDYFLIDWDPVDLVLLRFHITGLDARGLTVRSKGEERGPPSEPELPDVRLPVEIVIDRARVEDISIEGPGTDTTFTLKEISLGAHAGRESIRLQTLKVESALFTVTLAGELKPRGEYPIDITAGWSLRPAGYSPFVGAGTLTGSLEKLAVSQEVSEPISAKLIGTIEDLLDKKRWKASIVLDEFRGPKVNESWPPAELTGKVEGSGNLSLFELSGSFAASEPEYGNITGNYLARYENGAWKLDRLTMTRPGTDIHVMLSGEFASTEGGPSFLTVGKWKNFTWPLDGKEPTISSPEGWLRASGTPDDYSFQADTRLLGINVPEGKWVVKGRGNSKEAFFDSVGADLLNGKLSGKGEVRWRPEVAWNVVIDGSDIDPGVHFSEWPGRLAFNVRSSGTLAEGKPQITLDIDRLSGQLRRYPLEATADVEVWGDRYTVSKLELHSGAALFSASGHLSDSWDVKWEIDASDMSELIPGGEGSLAGKGQITGPRKMPRIITIVDGKNVAFDTAGVENINLDLDLDLQNEKKSRIDLSAKGIKSGIRQIGSFAAKGSGNVSSHQFFITLNSQKGALELNLTGGYRDRSWEGILERADVSAENFGKWALLKPDTIFMSTEKVQTGNLCWVHASSQVCSRIEWQEKKGLHGKTSLENVSFEMFGPALPKTVSLGGSLSGTVEASYRKDNDLEGEINLTASPGTVSYAADDKEEVRLSFQGGNFDVRLDESELSATLDVSLMDNDAIRGSLTLPRFTPFKIQADKQKIKGSAQAKVRDPGLIPLVYPNVENTAGTYKADLEFFGTLASPLIVGDLIIDRVAADISDLGIRIEDTRLSASSDGSGVVTMKGESRSKEGIVRIEGKAKIHPRKDREVRIHIFGDRFEAIKIPEAWALISPDLEVYLKGNRLNVEGELGIPEATIEPRDLSGAVPVSKDVFVKGEKEKEKEEEKVKIRSRVRLTMGDKVKFDGFGLTGRITGNVLAVDEPEKFTTGSGELRIIDGKYKAYGQKLEIERGRVVFAGGLIEDPGLDVRAVRRFDEVVVGVEVTGTVKSPRTALFSTPFMDQSDILSYLLLGKPMQSATSGEGQQLQTAALKAGLSGGEFLAKDIGEMFGFEEVGLEEGKEEEGASLVVGKYLSPKLYISYGIGLFEPISTYRIRYNISSKWLVQTEYGLNSGADLFYRIEK